MIKRVVVCGLAATRLVRAWRYERIGRPWLKSLMGYLERKPSARRDWLEYLITCPHCLGFWFTLLVTLFWRVRIARPLIEALAGAMIVSAFADHYPQFNFDEDDIV